MAVEGAGRGAVPGVALLVERARFVGLIAGGMGNAEACRIVGVNRRTGTRWRYGRTVRDGAGRAVHYPPVTRAASVPVVPSLRYLSLQERGVIADLVAAGWSLRRIAGELGRSVATISRELRRNVDGRGRSLPHTAQRAARSRQARPRPRRLASDPTLRGVVDELLAKRWSPEQIANALPARFPDEPLRQLCTESIYQALYDPATPLRRPAIEVLRSGRRRRRPRVRGQTRRRRLPSMTPISARPAAVADRRQAGHWEGDLIMGESNRSAIGTLIERNARFLILIHLPDAHTGEAVRDGITSAVRGLPAALRRTLTWDQGSEMALHQQTTALTGMPVYFCDPHAPWQRGSNENTNGLLRQYFPKGTDLRVHTATTLAAVAAELNNRPRKTLNWAAPADLFNHLLSSA
jgi:IS30 family transposase